MEILGAVAATTQLFGHLLDLVNALMEVRDHINHSSARIQAYQERLDSLARTIQYIHENPRLLTHVVSALLHIISQRVSALNDLLRKSFSKTPRRASQRLMRVYAEKTAERRIRELLEILDSYKVDLAISISATRQMPMGHVEPGRMEEDLVEGGIRVLEETSPDKALVPLTKVSTSRTNSFDSTKSTDTAGTTATTSTPTEDEQRPSHGVAQAFHHECTDNTITGCAFGIIGFVGDEPPKSSMRISRNNVNGGVVSLVGRADLMATERLGNTAYQLLPLMHPESKGFSSPTSPPSHK